MLVCAVALAGFAGSASARPAHKSGQKHAAASAAQTVKALRGGEDLGGAQDMRAIAPAVRSATQEPADGRSRGRKGRRAHAHDAFGGFTSNSLVSEARKYLGTNPTGRGSLWCGAFMDMVLKRTGHPGGGNLASAYVRYGTRVSGPQVGAIAVMGRRGGGHVGVVSGIDPNGNPIIVSGNHNHTVAESVYPNSRITAYVLPGG
jgi:uncharacterized protein (TIGR02594 family)